MVARLLVLSMLDGCATLLPYGHSIHVSDHPPASAFKRCEVPFYLIGVGIDGAIVAADVGFGEEINGWDALVFVPIALDALFGLDVMLSCLRD